MLKFVLFLCVSSSAFATSGLFVSEKSIYLEDKNGYPVHNVPVTRSTSVYKKNFYNRFPMPIFWPTSKWEYTSIEFRKEYVMNNGYVTLPSLKSINSGLNVVESKGQTELLFGLKDPCGPSDLKVDFTVPTKLVGRKNLSCASYLSIAGQSSNQDQVYDIYRGTSKTVHCQALETNEEIQARLEKFVETLKKSSKQCYRVWASQIVKLLNK